MLALLCAVGAEAAEPPTHWFAGALGGHGAQPVESFRAECKPASQCAERLQYTGPAQIVGCINPRAPVIEFEYPDAARIRARRSATDDPTLALVGAAPSIVKRPGTRSAPAAPALHPLEVGQVRFAFWLPRDGCGAAERLDRLWIDLIVGGSINQPRAPNFVRLVSYSLSRRKLLWLAARPLYDATTPPGPWDDDLVEFPGCTDMRNADVRAQCLAFRWHLGRVLRDVDVPYALSNGCLGWTLARRSTMSIIVGVANAQESAEIAPGQPGFVVAPFARYFAWTGQSDFSREVPDPDAYTGRVGETRDVGTEYRSGSEGGKMINELFLQLDE